MIHVLLFLTTYLTILSFPALPTPVRLSMFVLLVMSCVLAIRSCHHYLKRDAEKQIKNAEERKNMKTVNGFFLDEVQGFSPYFKDYYMVTIEHQSGDAQLFAKCPFPEKWKEKEVVLHISGRFIVKIDEPVHP